MHVGGGFVCWWGWLIQLVLDERMLTLLMEEALVELMGSSGGESEGEPE